ncbi:hypothetical protein AYR46_01620 [Sphingobium yanoikuyae]|nr:hypothetical protein AYR46_01620 [Sphingobium yanoikuyae]
MYFLLLYYLYLIAEKREGSKHSWTILALVSYTVFVSGSRSSILALACMIIFEFIRYTPRNIIAAATVSPLFLLAANYVFESRADNNARGKFLGVFLQEIDRFKFHEHLFGSMPLTPLSNWACSQLSFWQDLMSASDDGHCYALILHSFFMRVYFDHGIFGIIFVFAVAWICLSRGNLERKEVIGIISVPAVCALSVSSFASAFVSLPIAILCGARFVLPQREAEPTLEPASVRT